MGKIGEFLGSIAGKTGADIITAVGGVVDNLTLSPEEKANLKNDLTKEINRNMEAMKTLDNTELELRLKDNDSARQREVQITNSANAPKLNKMITPILALIVVGLTFAMWWAVLFKQFKNEDNSVVLFVLGSLSTMSAGVISYYFGSSAGSSQKSALLERMMEK